MRLTQGTFSFLPDLSDAQIRAQVEYCLREGWAVSLEVTDDPHPRNTYWEMYGNPMPFWIIKPSVSISAVRAADDFLVEKRAVVLPASSFIMPGQISFRSDLRTASRAMIAGLERNR